MKMEQDHLPPEQPSPHAHATAGEGPPGSAMQHLPPVGSAVTSAVTSPTSQISQDHPRDITLPPLALSFPGEPSAELAPIQPPYEKPAGAANQTLPPLSSLTGAQHASLPTSPEPLRPASHIRPTNHWPSLNPFTTYYTPSYLDPAESSSPSMGSEQSVGRKPPSVSLDDPDVRIAAEALGQMRTDCGASPRNRSTASSSTLGDRKSSKGSNPASPSPSTNRSNQPEQEPLLSLITTSHPLVATTIGSAASVYNNSKNYSPHLKTGAEYVESYLKPVGKAVGSVSRKTGVEGGMRWIFGIRSRKQRASSDIETGERGSSKRLKSERNSKGRNPLDTPLSESTEDPDGRRTSISTVDTLPVYDDQRSPAYTEVADNQGMVPPSPYPSGEQRWPQRFVVTTSGLGIAMKQESLKSLRYCLTVLRDTNGHVGGVVAKLKEAIDEYDRARARHQDGEGDEAMTSEQDLGPQSTADRSRLVQLMKELRDDIFNVIQQTVQIVSKYAGSALPENARNLVQRQLMSLPGIYQFHYVRESEGRARENNSSSGSNLETGARDSAHLALLFAREALLLMTQVGDVLNRTLESAEQWCEALYSRSGQAEGAEGAAYAEGEGEDAAAVDAEALRAALGGVALQKGEEAPVTFGVGAPEQDIVMSG